MAKTKTIEERMADTEKRLLQLKAKANLQKRREKSKQLRAAKKEQFDTALKLSREQDAHRKIELGGVVIAAGADHLDIAELCGALLAYLERRNDEFAARLQDRGLAHFEARKSARASK